MKSGVGALYLNSDVRKEIERANDRAGRLGLHIVHIFYKDAINGEPGHRSGYFESFAEAELFAKDNLDKLLEIKHTFIVLLDNELIGGKFVGEDAQCFMASDDGVKCRQGISIKCKAKLEDLRA